MSQFKLSAKEEATLNGYIDRLRTKQGEVEVALQVLSTGVSELVNQANTPIGEYNEILTEANNFVNRIIEAQQNAFDEKSEAWQSGDTGNEVSSWIDTWRAIDLTELAEVEIDLDDIPGLDPDFHAESLDELGSEP